MGSTSTRKKSKASESKIYVSWFEIPAINFKKAVDFYNFIYGIDMATTVNEEYHMAFFPSDSGVGGAVVAGPGSVPSETGPLLYLNGGDDLNKVLKKVESAGGRIIMPKTHIDKESGYFAIFIDSEGNKLALHSQH
ncbi:MAG: putative enzyme related to lactoylglutathione lyase [Bacteroidia bacterium]|jgi:predicted enzyme related to lactoylglutathione lyase